jgi:hypothetical protein
MRHPTLAFLAVAGCCAVAWAQAPAPQTLGTVAEVRGLVTMSLGANVATVQPDTPVFDGARFVSSSSGEAEIRFKNGCRLKLLPNQWVTIDSAQDCDTLIASIRTITDTNAAGGTLFARDLVPLLGSAALAGAIARLPDAPITPTPR